MKLYVKPTLTRAPDHLILHIGTDKKRPKHSSPQKISSSISTLGQEIKKELPTTNLVISEVITRNDDPNLNTKIEELNTKLSQFTMSSANGPSTSVECDVDRNVLVHFFLIPAGIIITILAFLKQRRSFMKEICGGRPGIVVPIDFLTMDHDRLAIMCVFGSAAGSIVLLIFQNISENRNAWEKAFLIIAICIEYAFLYYPYFGCLASYHRTLGALMGLSYAVTIFVLYMVAAFQKCNGYTTTHHYAISLLPEIPVILCHLFILGKFTHVLYKEIKEYGTCGVQFFFRKNEQSEAQVKLDVNPWLRDYVEDLINNPKPTRHYSRLGLFLRKIYNPEKNFKFSTQTLSVVMICSILLYAMSLLLVYFGILLLHKLDNSRLGNIAPGVHVVGTLIAAAIFALILCFISLIRFLENHKNNMLRMFKGDKSFIPRTINVSQSMIGTGLRYHSFQIGYFLWGYILLLILFWIIFIFVYSLSLRFVRDSLVGWLEGGGVLMAVGILTNLCLAIIVATIFRDYDFPKNVISINNRNVYLVLSYFWFFIGLPMGFTSAISRILKATAVGALMLPRIDHSVMPDGFQSFDGGFEAYICYLHVQTAYRNPVLRVFCQILSDETRQNRERKWTRSAQARARWFLALTLARNPQLASDRKPGGVQAPQPVQGGCVKHGDVKIKISRYDLRQHM